MKNANTRFVRVLALVLVVLMVVPAALVGCGSNKANNAAISEALAAAEAARKEAEEAKAAADAAAAEAAAKAAAEAQKALEEANKKAEEAIKAAEQAKKDAEQAQKDAEEAKKEAAEAAKTTAAPATQAPVTTAAPTGDMKIVSDYAYSVLSNKDLDFLKTYFTYAYGKSEKDLEKTDFDVKGTLDKTPENPIYTSVDLANMEVLYDATVVAIYQANTVDYINQLVSNFVNTITATKTYAEHVLAAYEAIDFASNYDVVDVVYAYQLLVKALADAKTAGNIPGTTTTYLDELEEKLTKYGENNVDVINAIAVEYYRYTGADIDTSIDADITDIEDDDILYDLMYEAAAEIVSAVQDLIKNNGAEYDDNGLMILDAAKLPYDPKIESAVANVVKKYTQWNTKYFVNADDADLAGYYEDFRKAFVGETYILKGEADFVWEALVAFEARATELLAAVAEYESGFKTELNSVAKPATIKYWNYIEKVDKVNAALEAWKLKYNFEDDENGNVDPNVTKIIEKYAAYETNAAIVAYFVYLEKSATAVNADAFLNAYKEDLHDNKSVMFTYSKYGSAVASVLDWYYGKEKNGARDSANAFEAIAPNEDKDFFAVLDDADDTYTVSKLIANKDQNILEMFERAFDLDIHPDNGKDKGAFVTMLDVYTKLRDAKEDADDINDDIEEYLEKGVSVKVETDLKTLLGDKYAEIFDPDVEEDDKYKNLAGAVDAWRDDNKDVIAVGYANFLEMIDWANIETLYDNYNGSTKSIKEAAVEVALMYIAWKGEYKVEDEIITYKGMDFEDLDPVEINIYSYDFIKKVLDLYSALDVKNAASVEIEVPINNDDDYVITLKDVANYCVELRTHFYSIVDTLQKDVYYTTYNDYAVLSQSGASAKNPWRSATHYSDKLADRELYYNAVVNAGNRINEQNDPNEIIKPAVLDVLKDSNFTRYSTGGYGNTNNTPAGAGTGIYDGKQFKSVSYQFAIYSVNPLKYATMSNEGKVLSFDSAAYKTALQTSIANMYKSFLASYYKLDNDTFVNMVANVASNLLDTGIWTISDEIVIADEEYAFEINTNKFGTAWELEILDADEEFVKHVSANVVTVEFEPKKNEKYTITLTATLDKGVLKIAPVLTPASADSTKTVYDFVEGLDKDYFEEKGELPYFAFDVRDYTEQIAANGDKVTNIVLLGGKTATLDTFSVAQYETLFAAEAKNLFLRAFRTYAYSMYYEYTSYTTYKIGSYISNISNKTEADAVVALKSKLGDDKAEAVAAELFKISQAAYQLTYGMTPDMNTVDDIKAEFEAFALEVQHKLDDLGVAYTVNSETSITIDGLKSAGLQ